MLQSAAPAYHSLQYAVAVTGNLEVCRSCQHQSVVSDCRICPCWSTWIACPALVSRKSMPIRLIVHHRACSKFGLSESRAFAPVADKEKKVTVSSRRREALLLAELSIKISALGTSATVRLAWRPSIFPRALCVMCLRVRACRALCRWLPCSLLRLPETAQAKRRRPLHATFGDRHVRGFFFQVGRPAPVANGRVASRSITAAR